MMMKKIPDQVNVPTFDSTLPEKRVELSSIPNIARWQLNCLLFIAYLSMGLFLVGFVFGLFGATSSPAYSPAIGSTLFIALSVLSVLRPRDLYIISHHG